MSLMLRSGRGCRVAAGEYVRHGPRLHACLFLKLLHVLIARYSSCAPYHLRSYQLCLFCYDRLKTEFSNRCPNCRVEYDSDFQAGLRRRQERVAQLQQQEDDFQQELAAKAAALAAAERSSSRHVQPPPPPPPPRVLRSPRRDLHIEQEQLWPSLGGGAGAQLAAPAAAHHPQQPTQPLAQRPAEAGSPRLGSPPRLAAILSQSPRGGVDQEASSSSSADTAATTPQSPVSSVVSFRAVPPAATCSSASKRAAACAAASAAVQGRCAVVLQRCCVLGVDADPEGASLAASLQDAVRAGSLSVKQAAASLASHLRQRQLHHASGLSGSAGSSPARSSRQPSSAGSTGAGGGSTTPFSMPAVGIQPVCGTSGTGGLLASDGSFALCGSSLSSMATTSASLSHWAPAGSATLPLPATAPALLDGTASGTWQQQQPQQASVAPLAASPVRDNDRLPLFMRRGSLPGAAVAAAEPMGGPGSSRLSSGTSFPGFPPSASGTPPAPELKRTLAAPPGFGPPTLGTTGIATLPRFR